MAKTVAEKKTRDAIIRRIGKAEVWATIQKTNTLLIRASCGGVLFKDNEWIDLLKEHYAKASLQEFEKLIQEVDEHLVFQVSGPNAKKGKPCYKRWLKKEAKDVN